MIFLDLAKAFGTIHCFTSWIGWALTIGDRTDSCLSTTLVQAHSRITCPLGFDPDINDIPSAFNCLLALFADSIAILSYSQISTLVTWLQNYLNSILDFFKASKLVINPDKMEVILFTRRSKLGAGKRKTALTIENHTIPWSSEVRYLGVFLDQRLNRIIKTIRVADLLTSHICHKFLLQMLTTLSIFKLCIRPVLTYGAHIWNLISMKTQRKC